MPELHKFENATVQFKDSSGKTVILDVSSRFVKGRRVSGPSIVFTPNPKSHNENEVCYDFIPPLYKISIVESESLKEGEYYSEISPNCDGMIVRVSKPFFKKGVLINPSEIMLGRYKRIADELVGRVRLKSNHPL